jgi:FkbM family methyltransferase
VIRALVERISRGIRFQRRLPSEVGGLRLFVSPDASLRYLKSDMRSIDPLLLECAAKLVDPGDAVWDVGANVGLFTFASAGLAGEHGRVLAIEPDPWLSALLRDSVRLNGEATCSVEVLQIAVTDRPGNAILNIARRGRAANFLSGYVPSTQTGGARDATVVQTVTLDNLLDDWGPPRVVKIDVEGAEASVFRGATKLLEKARPKIICEVSSANRAQVTAMLQDAEYLLYDAKHNWPDCEPLRECAWDTVALPVNPT